MQKKVGGGRGMRFGMYLECQMDSGTARAGAAEENLNTVGCHAARAAAESPQWTMIGAGFLFFVFFCFYLRF
jgi:hypothetical protein